MLPSVARQNPIENKYLTLSKTLRGKQTLPKHSTVNVTSTPLIKSERIFYYLLKRSREVSKRGQRRMDLLV